MLSIFFFFLSVDHHCLNQCLIIEEAGIRRTSSSSSSSTSNKSSRSSSRRNTGSDSSRGGGSKVIVAAAASSLSSSSSSSSFEWERDAKGFYDRHFIVLFVAALMYYPVILGIKYLMRNRKAFDLGGAKSRAMVNWIFWWEASLAAFSFVAATQVVILFV